MWLVDCSCNKVGIAIHLMLPFEQANVQDKPVAKTVYITDRLPVLLAQ